MRHQNYGLALVAGQTMVNVGQSSKDLVTALQAKYEKSAQAQFIMVAMRNLYWRTGIDPTKIRPSSEALWKATTRGLRSINNAVDTCNLLSLQTGYPFSVFDAEKLQLPLIVDFAGEEEFTPVTHRVMRLKPGLLVVRDQEQLICAGYATADAYETRVHEETKKMLYLVYVPPKPEELEQSKKGSTAANLTVDLSIRKIMASDEAYYKAALAAGEMMAEALTKWCDGETLHPPTLYTA